MGCRIQSRFGSTEDASGGAWYGWKWTHDSRGGSGEFGSQLLLPTPPPITSRVFPPTDLSPPSVVRLNILACRERRRERRSPSKPISLSLGAGKVRAGRGPLVPAPGDAAERPGSRRSPAERAPWAPGSLPAFPVPRGSSRALLLLRARPGLLSAPPLVLVGRSVGL